MRKENIYVGDALDEELDSDVPVEEAERGEALRLQKEQLQAISEEDFQDDMMILLKKSAKVAQKAIRKGKEDVRDKMELDFDHVPFDLSIEDSNLPKKSAMETVQMQVKNLSKEELEIALKEKFPELNALLSEVKEHYEELDEVMMPLCEKIREQRNRFTDEGVAFVHLKTQALWGSCLLICFYIACLTESSKSKARAKCIEKLAIVRKIFKELEPFDEKLRDQLIFVLEDAEENDENLTELLNDMGYERKEQEEVQDNASVDDDDNENDLDDNGEASIEDDDEQNEIEPASNAYTDDLELKLLALKSSKKRPAPSYEMDEDEPKIVTTLKKKEKLKETKAVMQEDDTDLLEVDELVQENPKPKKIAKNNESLAKEAPVSLKEIKYRNDVLPDGVRRKPGYEVIKNKGLMRYRKPGAHNSRVSLKNKFVKAQRKQNALVKQYVGKEDNYSGERFGIRANVAKSTRL